MIESKCSAFMWGYKNGKRKISLVAWETICSPKQFGGLNLKSCTLWNLAAVGKQIWNIATKQDMLWVKWVHGIYIKGDCDVWDHIPSNDSSWHWKKMMKARDKLKDCIIQTPQYTISVGYAHLMGVRERLRYADLIWTSVAAPRVRFFCWMTTKERLLTRERLLKLQVQVEDHCCCLCTAQVIENQAHLFCSCSWFGELWQLVQDWLGCHFQVCSVADTLWWIKRRKWKGFKKQITAAAYSTTLYYTWQARNWKIFRNSTLSPSYAFTQVQQMLRGRLMRMINSRKARACSRFINSICE